MAGMRDLLLLCFVLAVMWRMHDRATGSFYRCGACGTSNGDHSEGCPWNKK